MDPKKVFSEQEAAQLIVDAAKLQESAGQHDYTPGVTWTELQRMADDVGVDPDYLKKALAKKSTNSKPTVKPKVFLECRSAKNLNEWSTLNFRLTDLTLWPESSTRWVEVLLKLDMAAPRLSVE